MVDWGSNPSHYVGERQQGWIKENWREYGKESKDRFWTSRGHDMGVKTQVYRLK